MADPIHWPLHFQGDALDVNGRRVDWRTVIDMANAAHELAIVLRTFRELAEAGQHVDRELIERATAALGKIRG